MSVPTPSVSVVIPTRNGGALLLETLTSVFAQSHPAHEVLVVDDGSTDDTGRLLAPFEAAGRLRVLAQAGAGTAAARNTGVRHATGDFLALLDHDDVWPADKLEWQVDQLSSHPDAVLVYGYMESFGLEQSHRWPDTIGPAGDVRRAFRRKNWIRSPGQTLIRTDAVRAAGGFDAAVAGADDWDLYLRLADQGSFAYAHRLALRYRVHRGNQSRQAWTLFRRAWQVHNRHAGAVPPHAPRAAVSWLLCRATLVHMLARDLTSRLR